MPKREVPRTQRATAEYGDTGKLVAVDTLPYVASVPVLVVPEAAVSGCRHDNPITGSGDGGYVAACQDCGAVRWGTDRWQRPRILRVGRASK